MLKKRYMIIAVGLVSVLIGSLLVSNLILAQSGGEYDPWMDLNDDGTIDVNDLYSLGQTYGTSGEPINKTALLLELNATVAKLLTTLYVDDVNKRVGIGTTSPTAKLEVVGDASISGDLVVGGSYFGFPRPAYDSGWQSISAGSSITLTHNIGGNIDNYVVDMQFKAIDIAAIGINNVYYGSQHQEGGIWVGADWRELTSTSIKVVRSPSDPTADQVRVRIWVYQ